MKKQIILLPLLLIIITAIGNRISIAGNFDHTYSDYSSFLSKNVSGGKVNYSAVKSSPDNLNKILESYSAVTKEQYDSWNENQKLAFLINYYNAETIRLIANNYPLKSIKDIGEPWDIKLVSLFGKKISLNQLEHEIIRKEFNEPRIHFALVCAAKGCPELISEPYLGASLDSQLENSTKTFLLIKEKNSIDDGKQVISVSPIFDWFKEDFTGKSGSVTEFLAPYYSKNPGDLKNYQIKYTFYDWSLNDKT